MDNVFEELSRFLTLMLEDDELNEKFKVTLSRENAGIVFRNRKNEEEKLVLDLTNIIPKISEGESYKAIAKTIKRSIVQQFNLINDIFNFEDIKTKIFPLIKSELRSPVKVVKKPFDEDGELFVYYVRDLEDAMAYIPTEEFNKWGISIDELHAIAIENLKNTPVMPKLNKVGENTDEFLVFDSNDGYDASRILTLDMGVLCEKFSGRVCVGIPNRDFLIVFDEKNQVIDAFREQIRIDSETKSYPISGNMFVYDNGVWKVLE